MSIQNSNLAKYGYDTVVAVTQKALNNAIETYYKNSKFTPVTYYYIKDSSGNPVAVDKATLLSTYTSNIDPLGNVSASQQKVLAASQFYFAFNFTIGNPQGFLFYDPTTNQEVNYLTLSPESNNVKYCLLCFQLQVAFWNPDTKVWVSIKQTTSKEFNIYANVNLTSVLSNTNLTPSVQAAVDTLGGTDLNIQQLIFDLDSSVVDPTSTLTQLDSSCSVFKPLMQEFAKAYFGTYNTQSGALNYAITTSNPSSMVPNAMEWRVNAYVNSSGVAVQNPTQDQQDLATLNYLFANNGDSLPAGTQLNWNWLEDNGTSHNLDIDTNADVNKFDGAIAIKRDAFAKYLISQLNSYVQQNCWAAFIDEDGSDPGTYGDLDFTLGSLPANVFQPYNPYAIAAGDPDQLLVYFYDKIFTLPVLQTNNPTDSMSVNCYFSLQVLIGDGHSVPASTITLQQSFQVKINASITNSPDPNAKPTLYSGSPVNKTFNDVFNVQLSDQGGIAFNKNMALSTSSDASTDVNLPFDNDWDSTDDFVQNLAARSFTEFPFSLPSQFVFPGGNAFTYQDASFSSYSDLVCRFTYKAETLSSANEAIDETQTVAHI